MPVCVLHATDVDDPRTRLSWIDALKDCRKLEFAEEPEPAMDLVLFKDALLHVCRVHRVLMQPRGNALLVGVGGSGRKSLARLATFTADLKCFSIEITKNYRLMEFREDLKTLFRQAGVADKPTVFLFDETQIVVETFLEDINNVLTSGEVPNLFTKDELSGVCEDVRADAKRAGAGEMQDELYQFFLSRVIKNLHMCCACPPPGQGSASVAAVPRLGELLHHRLVHGGPRRAAGGGEEADGVGEGDGRRGQGEPVQSLRHLPGPRRNRRDARRARGKLRPATNYWIRQQVRALLTEKRAKIGAWRTSCAGTLKLDETSVRVGE